MLSYVLKNTYEERLRYVLISASAMLRYLERQKMQPAGNVIEEFIDEHYDVPMCRAR